VCFSLSRKIPPALLLLALPACLGAQQDLCDKVPDDSMLTARDPVTPLSILTQVLQEVGLTLSSYRLIPVSGAGPVQNNASAKVCTQPACNCIFYDPAFIGVSPASREQDWNAVFVLAHETAHHVLQHLLQGSPAYNLPRRQKEAQADNWAGWALERLGASVDAVMAGADYIATSERDTENYYGRCHRRMDALEGYNRGRRKDGKPLYQACGECFPALSRGLYLVRDAGPGALRSEMVTYCGQVETPDLPARFDSDLRGGCLIQGTKAGALLTWHNVGLCR